MRQLSRRAGGGIRWLSLFVLAAGLITRGLAAAADDDRLARAAKARAIETVRTLLKEHADVKGALPDGATALHWAAHWNDLEMAQLLIGAGADPNAGNVHYRVTPLALACQNGSAPMVRALLGAGANANATQLTGETALMTAARTGNADVVADLLAHGADVNAVQPGSGQTALMWAAAEEHAAVVRVLVEHGAHVGARSAGGFTPLLFAVRQGNEETVGALLAAGADVNQPAADGGSPLVVATVRGRTAIATRLLERGADANAAGSGYTALHWAAGSWPTTLSGINGIVTDDEEWRTMTGLKGDKLAFVRTLLAHGADPNARMVKGPPRVGIGTAFIGNLAGATPFLLAAMAGDVEVMRALVEHGADPNLATRQRATPLMVAAGLGRELSVSFVTEKAALEAVTFVLSLAPDVNAANAAGDTALHAAAFIKADAVIRVLVEHGANVNAENARGETPLTAAEQVVQGGSLIRARVRTKTGDLLRELGGR